MYTSRKISKVLVHVTLILKLFLGGFAPRLLFIFSQGIIISAEMLSPENSQFLRHWAPHCKDETGTSRVHMWNSH